jgi:hypothetical protein
VRVLAVRIPPRLDRALVAAASADGQTVSDFVRAAIASRVGEDRIAVSQPPEPRVDDLLAALDDHDGLTALLDRP